MFDPIPNPVIQYRHVIIFRYTYQSGMYLLFSIVNEIYEYYEARSAISLFQINKLFSHHFRGFKLEIFDPSNSCNPIRFPALSNEYSNDCRYDPVLCLNKLIYQQQINSLTKRLILTTHFDCEKVTWTTRQRGRDTERETERQIYR